LKRGRNTYYAERWFNTPTNPSGKGGTYSMHREILGLTHGDKRYGDHINMNGLDNRRTNLRIVSGSLNAANSKLRTTNKSGYRGVSWHKHTNRWRAQFRFNGNLIHCGEFKTTEEAYAAYLHRVSLALKEGK